MDSFIWSYATDKENNWWFFRAGVGPFYFAERERNHETLYFSEAVQDPRIEFTVTYRKKALAHELSELVLCVEYFECRIWIPPN